MQELHRLLGDLHNTFCLENQECGEIDLIIMEIDTEEAHPSPRKLPARWIPHAFRYEVTKELREMQQAGDIPAWITVS